jgi:hypothetical protein
MYVKFERSGGYMGLPLRATLDSSSLQADQLDSLYRLLEETHFFELPEELDAACAGSDRFCYRVYVEDGGRRHEIQASEEAVPDRLWPLLKWLTQQARCA